MSGPHAEGGPLPPPDPEVLARHEERIAELQRERTGRDDEVLRRVRDGLDEL